MMTVEEFEVALEAHEYKEELEAYSTTLYFAQEQPKSRELVGLLAVYTFFYEQYLGWKSYEGSVNFLLLSKEYFCTNAQNLNYFILGNYESLKLDKQDNIWIKSHLVRKIVDDLKSTIDQILNDKRQSIYFKKNDPIILEEHKYALLYSPMITSLVNVLKKQPEKAKSLYSYILSSRSSYGRDLAGALLAQETLHSTEVEATKERLEHAKASLEHFVADLEASKSKKEAFFRAWQDEQDVAHKNWRFKIEEEYKTWHKETNSAYNNWHAQLATDYAFWHAKTEENYQNWHSQTEEKYKTWYQLIQKELHDTKAAHQQFDEEARARMEQLESTYQEELRLTAPAKHWEERAKKLNKQFYLLLALVIILLALAITSLGLLLWHPPESLFTNSFFKEDKSAAIRWSIIYITFLSFIAFATRSFIKAMFSALHLARDCQERSVLTYFYLSLINEKDVELDKEERQLIMQALFSRAETGLLKDEGGPAMPNNLLNKVLSGK